MCGAGIRGAIQVAAMVGSQDTLPVAEVNMLSTQQSRPPFALVAVPLVRLAVKVILADPLPPPVRAELFITTLVLEISPATTSIPSLAPLLRRNVILTKVLPPTISTNYQVQAGQV